MTKKHAITIGISLFIFVILAAGITAFAATTNTPPRPVNTMMRIVPGNMRNIGVMQPAIIGSVTAINGTNLTILSRTGRSGQMMGKTSANMISLASTTYTVDASSATIIKNGTTTTISMIAVNDTITAQGKITGTLIKASRILDDNLPTAAYGASEKISEATSSHSGYWPTYPASTTPAVVHESMANSIGSFFKHMFGL